MIVKRILLIVFLLGLCFPICYSEDQFTQTAPLLQPRSLTETASLDAVSLSSPAPRVSDPLAKQFVGLTELPHLENTNTSLLEDDSYRGHGVLASASGDLNGASNHHSSITNGGNDNNNNNNNNNNNVAGASTFKDNAGNARIPLHADMVQETSFSSASSSASSISSSSSPSSSAAAIGESVAPERAASIRAKQPSIYRVPVLYVAILTSGMSLLSALGALPFLFMDRLGPYWSGLANAVGCGVMLAASFELFAESRSFDPSLVVLGVLLGVVGMQLSQALLDRFEDVTFADLQGADARKVLLIFGVMAIHAVGEGAGVGVSFSGARGWTKGIIVTIAIGLHNIPEGMAMASVLIAKGTTPAKAVRLTCLSALPQAAMAVPAFLCVEAFASLLPVAMGFAAGCMIWIVFAELVPDALEHAPHTHVASAATLAATWLQAIGMAIAQLENPDGSLNSPFSMSVSGPISATTFISTTIRNFLVTAMWMLPTAMVMCGLAAVGASRLFVSLSTSLGASVGLLTCLAVVSLAQGVALLRELSDGGERGNLGGGNLEGKGNLEGGGNLGGGNLGGGDQASWATAGLGVALSALGG
eukprot:CAMPEP_0175081960 /NCGR_PEP_ID=MMETSP0052_2-20121109/26470_1 /TAXON_ID=51329 ORGANISM="Polytomella parva, Strain SAG 63-3" /NCGR_SAMPLE_ID=MMETSP0052_2 /ASSEMBLY_ACC=CAM_ASM_000194 /LENGTH=588 /DNA_ID=CAMNT_0016353063 /DNA_START=103 /DNA_END=1866 /DNA_ORIENTATION=-